MEQLFRYSPVPRQRVRCSRGVRPTVELCRAPGFRSTAFCDLTAELGISRRSLYATDADKQLLLPASLQWYRERSLDQLRRFLDTPGPVRPVLAQLFEGVISGPCAKGNPGCFMVNSLVEMAPQDEAIRAMALAPARDLAGLFAARLSAPQRASARLIVGVEIVVDGGVRHT